MSLMHLRCQRAVGHGFFHSAQIKVGEQTFRYLYDCGGRNMRERVDEYLREDGGNRSLDALFVSHLHSDHVSGLERLLARVEVRTVVLPFLPYKERLLQALETLETSDASTSHLESLKDPARWLQARGVQRVIVVRGSDEGDPNLPGDGLPDLPELPDLQRAEDAEGRDLPLQLDTSADAQVARDDQSAGSTGSGRGTKPSATSQISHKACLLLRQGQPLWYFLTFVQQAPSAELETFYKELRKLVEKSDRPLLREGRKRNVFEALLADPELRRRLKKAYSGVFSDFNRTSLCLYSGRGGASPDRTAVWLNARLPYRAHNQGRHAWLATGDAVLKDTSVRRAFLEHFQPVLPSVLTLSLPHHGSVRNFDSELLKQVNPGLVFATCPSKSRNHPSPTVVAQVGVSGAWFWRVTDDPETELREAVEFPQDRGGALG